MTAYIEIVAVHGASYAPLLLRRELLFGEFEHQGLPAHLISTAGAGIQSQTAGGAVNVGNKRQANTFQ